jgi:formate hydrogenlyase subunit 3/multisubunit Na+/H+ antiporter MnhD subunit
MSEFELIWESSRYNVFYYLSWGSPLIVLFVAIFFRRWWGLVVGIGLTLLVTFSLVCLAAESKWSIRRSAAKEERDIQAVAEMDSANLAFTPIHAFIWAVGSTTLCAVPSALLIRHRKLMQRSSSVITVADVPSELVTNDNPYHPPSSK